MNLKQMRIGDFRGVDYSSSPHNASPFRAVDGVNWIHQNGVNKKRNGWEQVFPPLNSGYTTFANHINGMFPYKGTTGTEILLFTSKKAYRMYKTGGAWGYQELQNPTYTLDNPESDDIHACYNPLYVSGKLKNLDDRLLMATEDANYIYVPAGGYYCYDKTNHRLFELNGNAAGMTAEKAYVSGLIKIPCTTTGRGDINSVETGASLDAVNLLTPYRVNHFIYEHTTEMSASFALDAPVSSTTDYAFRINGAIENHVTTNISGGTFGLTFSYLDGDTPTANHGYDNQTVEIDVVFKGGWNAPSLGTICTTFGIGGYSDRMFIGGATNTVYFSEEDDYSYFPDIFTAKVGSSNTKVNGFLRLTDGVLAVFKERSANDPTIYYMTGRRDVADDGTVTPVFTVTPGNLTETPVTPFVTGTLGSDSLVANNAGVFGIALTENVVASNRTAQNRSALINEKLRKQDLSAAVATIYKGQYYLAANGEVFIANSDQTYKSKDQQWWQYEWYHFDHCPVRYWCVVDDVLMFGTDSGRICAFDDETLYRDVSLTEVQAGTITAEAETIAYSDTIKDQIEDGKTFCFVTAGVYGKEAVAMNGTAVTFDSNEYHETLYVGKFDNDNLRLTDGDKWSLFAWDDREGYGWVSVNEISVDNDGYAHITLNDSGGEDIDPPDPADASTGGYGTTLYLFHNLQGESLYIKNNTAEESGGTFQAAYEKDGATVDIEPFPGESLPGVPTIRFITGEPVVALWKTPLFDMGTNTHRKTLLRLTICADSDLDGDILFGYETKNSLKDMHAEGETYFTFDRMDFANFAIASKFASSYTVRSRERGFNYIQFYFKSETPTDCVVHDMTATYRVIAENKGVR